MTIDLGVGAIVLVFALMGLASGFWSQILRLGALASLFFIAPPVAQAIESPVAGFMSDDATPKAVEGTALIVAAIGLYLIISLILFFVLRAVRGNRPMSGTNRTLGFVLGAVKGAALCYFILAGLTLVSQSVYYQAQLETNDFWAENASDSKLVELVEENNLLETMGYELPTPEEIQRELEEYGVEDADLPIGQTGTDEAAPEQPTPAQPTPEQPTPAQPTPEQPTPAQPGGAVGPGTPDQPGGVVGPGSTVQQPAQPPAGGK